MCLGFNLLFDVPVKVCCSSVRVDKLQADDVEMRSRLWPTAPGDTRLSPFPRQCVQELALTVYVSHPMENAMSLGITIRNRLTHCFHYRMLRRPLRVPAPHD